jgi:hypothetical protein
MQSAIEQNLDWNCIYNDIQAKLDRQLSGALDASNKYSL